MVERNRRRLELAALACFIVAALAFAAGAGLAWHHPVAPAMVGVAFVVCCAVMAGLPGSWLFIVPAALPLLNFSPWTGWLVFDEFDVLVLAALAAGHARLALEFSGYGSGPSTSAQSPARSRAGVVLLLAFAALGLLGLYRGVVDAGGWAFGWFDGYAQAMNSLRVFKSLFYAAAFWPLLRRELRRSTPQAIRRLALGMQAGLMFVGLAVLWERAAYPGLLDFSTRYRTTALFWEMHVGGAAIDAYLALATPFAAWALWSARSRGAWAAAAGLALLTAYACLTTFSRGVYLAVAVPLLGLALVWWLRRDTSDSRATSRRLTPWLALGAAAALLLSAAFAMLGYAGLGTALTVLMVLMWAARVRRPALQWRTLATMSLTLALIAEAVAVIGGGSFMRTRLLESEHDFGSRLAHWRDGLGLLHGPTDWLLGVGLGRLPSRYARFVPAGEFSGAFSLAASGAGRQVLRLSGPPTDEDLGGLYSVTQRVALRAGGAYRVGVVVRAAVTTALRLSVCEEHLLYARDCQVTVVRVVPRGGAWQQVTARLQGPALSAGDWYAPRLGVFAMSVTNAGAVVELAHVELRAPDGKELLVNRDFAAGLAHWFPVAQSYFLPWHIDNLVLEILIERGLSGLAVFGALLGCALARLVRASRDGLRFAPILAASLCGALLVGSVSSVMDGPRIAFLLLFLASLSLQLPPRNRVATAE